jgi:hypothetical protein
MRREDIQEELEARLAANRPEMPDDIERRFAELQGEMQRVDLSPSTVAGETREERYERVKRLQAHRREFDSMSRYPLAKRARTNPITIIAMAGISVLLCMFSFIGGTLLNGVINRPAQFTDVSTYFWQYMVTQQYDSASRYVTKEVGTVVSFSQQANDTDTALGKISKITPLSQNQNGSSAKGIYTVTRAGGTVNKQQNDSTVQLSFVYNSNSNSWQINSVGTLFTAPSSS